MNRLECQVQSCQHYQNHQCCLAGIQVDGPSAQEASQTCCASYEERRPGSAQNAQPLPGRLRLRGLLLRGRLLQKRYPVPHLPEQVTSQKDGLAYRAVLCYISSGENCAGQNPVL